jgi:hypothetical protein
MQGCCNVTLKWRHLHVMFRYLNISTISRKGWRLLDGKKKPNRLDFRLLDEKMLYWWSMWECKPLFKVVFFRFVLSKILWALIKHFLQILQNLRIHAGQWKIPTVITETLIVKGRTGLQCQGFFESEFRCTKISLVILAISIMQRVAF